MIEQISIPEGFTWTCFSRLKIVRIKKGATPGAVLLDRLRHSLTYGRHTDYTEVVIELSDLSILESLYQFRRFLPKVRIVVSSNEMGELHRNRSRLSTVSPVLVLDRCDNSLSRAVQFIASLNLPIEVTPSVFMAEDESSLLDLGSRLLCSPFVKIPVYPFFAMLQSALDEEGSSSVITLWDICGENPGQYYYISDDGKITLSKRWVDKNRFFGSITDSIDDVHASVFFKEVLSMRKSGHSISAECPECRVLRFCAGYLRALDKTQDCSPFVSLYKFMCSHASSLKENYAALTEEQKYDVFRAIARPVQKTPGRYSGRRTYDPGPPDFSMQRNAKSNLSRNEK